MKKKLAIFGIFVGALVAAFLIGRTTAPTKVKIEEKTRDVVVEKVVERVKTRTVTERKIEARPDGTTITHESIREARDADLAGSREATKESERKITKTTPQSRSRLMLGVSVIDRQSYTLGIQSDILGPFGAFAQGTASLNGDFAGFVGLTVKF